VSELRTAFRNESTESESLQQGEYMNSTGTAFCLAEDRADCETGLRLAILSLSKHCPETPIYVYRPNLNSTFAAWVRRFPQVTLIPNAPAGASAWNCKPQALKPLLASGYREVVWLDSDIIVTRDCRHLFTALDERVLVIAQEPASLPHQGTEERTRGWNLEVGRCVPFTLNSSVLRVTKHHLSLLERWTEYLNDPKYVSAQTMPLDERALHMMSDQCVLNALLGGSEFANIPLRPLSTGIEIIHAGGALAYSTMERLRGALKRKPAFLHASAGKPWLWLSGAAYWSKPDFFSWHRRLLQELSPYVFESRQYRDALGGDSGWMFRRTTTGSLLRLLGLGHFALRGLPVTMAASLMVSLKKAPRQPNHEHRSNTASIDES
jgi:hypothetical protein